MTFESSGTITGMNNSNPKVQEGEWKRKNPFSKFGNGKGMKKNIPEIREWEGNGREAFPKFENGKGRKNPFPYFTNGNQRLSIRFREWTGIPAHPCMS